MNKYNFKGGNNRYGIPYKGSKNKVVKWLVECLPSSENFYDLFCGGCAVTHYAILQHRWRNFHINDINPMLAPMFVDAINGKFENETRWISCEEFHRLKAIDPYVSICFSFGNNMHTYAYGEDKEELKKAIHYACYFKDLSLLQTFMPECNEILKGNTTLERYRIYQHLCKRLFSSSKPLENLVRHHNLENLQSLNSINSIKSYSDDYQNIEIKPNSTVYCDIPYRSTNTYKRVERFDYDRFYTWADSRNYPVFISEYDMPKEFTPISFYARKDTMCATKNNLLRCEKLFVQKRFAEKYKRHLFV